MKNIALLAPLPLALLFAAASSFGQPPAAPSRYLSVISVKVAPDKVAAFLDFYKSGPGVKSARARLKADPNLLRWTVLQAVYPGDPAPAANFLIASVTNGAPPDPDDAKRDELYRTATGMVYADYMQKFRTMGDNVGSTISHVHNTTDGYSLSPGDYLVLNRLKTTEGKNTELSDLMRDFRLPMANERAKAGGDFKGWSFSHLTFPGGRSLPYDASEVSVFKTLAAALGGAGTGGGAMATFAKHFPNKSYTGFVDAGRESSRLVRHELYRVVMAAQQ